MEELLSSYFALELQHVVVIPFPSIPPGFHSGKYGSLLWRARWKGSSRTYPEWKKLYPRMQLRYVGWLLLDASTGDTNRRIQETKDDKKSFLCYIYLILATILYRDRIFTLWTVHSNSKNILIFFFIKNVLSEFIPFSHNTGRWWTILVAIFGFSNVKYINITLEFSQGGFFFADHSYFSIQHQLNKILHFVDRTSCNDSW